MCNNFDDSKERQEHPPNRCNSKHTAWLTLISNHLSQHLSLSKPLEIVADLLLKHAEIA